MKGFAFLSTLLAPALAAGFGKRASSAEAIAFQNFGFTGYYYDVESFLNIDSKKCSCKLLDDFTVFEGTNSPLNEEVSVHLRGPLTLELFGAYYADDLSSGTWQRISYYNANNQTADNVTFLTNAGDDSPCLGKALTYAGANGTAAADEPTILEADNLVNSNQEYAIFSNITCPDSSSSGSCGVYRDGIPAYHGFYGVTKMFLFEFQMPEATVNSTAYYDMPAIWFLNAKIPRTSQYSSSASCSCWNSGCGELDIFEVMNSTETTHLYSTIHDYQGTSDINNGMQADAYFTRDTSSTMKGGVVFGTDGTITVFMLDDLTISSSLDAETVTGWVSSEEEVKTLSSVTLNTSSTSKKSEGIIGVEQSWGAFAMSIFFSFFMYF